MVNGGLMAFSLYWLRVPFLIGISELLIVNHPLQETELMFILGRDGVSAVDHAATIYPKVRPKLILVSPNGREHRNVGRLVNLHRLPAEKIGALPSAEAVGSTYEEALALRNYCHRVTVRSVTILTGRFHTGRAHWTFRTVLPAEVEIRMAGAPEEGFSKNNWWQVETGVVAVNNEFLKWAYYRWKYAD